MAYEIENLKERKSVHRPPISEMQEYRLRSWRDQHPSHKKAFSPKYDLSKMFLEELERKRDSAIAQHSILEINGDTGSGKSEIGMALACRYMTNGPKQVKICMEASAFNDLVSKAKRGDCIIRDEQPMRVGLGSVRENLQLVNIGEICRKYQLNFVFISPSNRNLVLPHFRLQTIWMDLERRENRLAVMDPIRGICLGSITIPILKKNPLKDRYEKRKDQFIDATRKGEITHDLLMKKARELINDHRFEKIRNNNTRKAYLRNKYPIFTTGEIIQILENVKMLREGILD